MATAHPAQESGIGQSSTFLRLPVEVRCLIYQELLKQPATRVDRPTRRLLRTEGLQFDLASSQLLAPVLAQTCKLLQDEFTDFCTKKEAADVASLTVESRDFLLFSTGTQTLTQRVQAANPFFEVGSRKILLRILLTHSMNNPGTMRDLRELIKQTVGYLPNGLLQYDFEIRLSNCLVLDVTRFQKMLSILRKELVQVKGSSIAVTRIEKAMAAAMKSQRGVVW